MGSPRATPGAARFIFVAAALGALLWAVLARVAGPSDIWDQRQPRTISYTVDILVSGGHHWILPVEHGEYPATKPPLYNWIAAPLVALLGFSSEVAHKFPSLMALCLCWLALVRLGRRLDPSPDGALGWVAATAAASGYSFFKLGYLARPDMLLTLWLLGGWIAATALIVAPPAGAARRTLLAGAFWGCVALAALTKGPPALVLPIYALVAARYAAGSWRAAGALGWWWGLPLAAGVFGLWLWAVWRIDPYHLVHTLWFEEFFGRVTGLGDEGNVHGPVEFLKRLPNMPFYFFTRFWPWSFVSLVGIIALWSRADDGRRRWRVVGDPAGPWLHSAALFALTIVIFFSLSTGKRADYIAATIPPAALLAAWWLLREPPRAAVEAPWIVPLTAAVTLTALTIYNELEPRAPQRGFGEAIAGFTTRAEAHLRSEPAPVVVRSIAGGYVASCLGLTSPGRPDEQVQRLLAEGGPFWLVAPARADQVSRQKRWLRRQGLTGRVTLVHRSRETASGNGWPGVAGLLRVEPQEDPDGR